MTGAIRAALALLAGAISALAFAPFDLWPAMAAALMALVWLLDRVPSARAAFATGWCFAYGQLVAGLYWIAIAFRFQQEMPAALGALAVLLLSAYLALFGGLACLAAWRLRPRTGSARVLVLAVAWTAGEWLRGTMLTGFPWNLTGSIWADWPVMAQAASLVGVHGLTLLSVAAFGSLALVAGHGRVRWIAPAAALAVLGAQAVYGLLQLAITRVTPASSQQVHIIQANIGQDEKWNNATFRVHFRRYLDMTRQAVATGGPGLVIWPETAIPNLIEDEVSTRYLIARAIGPGSMLITGGLRADRDAQGYPVGARNSVLAVSATGHVLATYDKAHLVPFGEYLPARPLLEALGLSRLAPGGMDFTPGPGPRTLDLPGVPPVSPLVCYEGIFPAGVVDRTRRPAWLLNVSNDGWFGISTGPWQHLAQMRLRGIEQGLPVVRSTPTGISAVFDARGRLLGRIEPGKQASLTRRLPPPLPATPYARWGDAMLAALMLAVSLMAWLMQRYSRVQPSPGR